MTCIVSASVMGLVLIVAVSLALYANYRWMQRFAQRGRDHAGRNPRTTISANKEEH